MKGKGLGAIAGPRISDDQVLHHIVGARPRSFKAPRVPQPPADLADRLDWSAAGVDELGLGDDGLRGGSQLLRDAAAEIRALRRRLKGTDR